MRPRPFVTLCFATVALLCAPALASAADDGAKRSEDGGAVAPEREAGGTEYGSPKARGRKRPRKARGPLVERLRVGPNVAYSGGQPVRVAIQVRAVTKRVRLRLDVVRPGSNARRVATVSLGERPANEGILVTLPMATVAGLTEGGYEVRLFARDLRGRALTRSQRLSARRSLRYLPAAFPIAGPYDLGGAEARFGADRGDRRHEGQDVVAAEGTPLVAPRAGTVSWVAFQEAGAGEYLVVEDASNRSYAFMHMRRGSTRVREGQRVSTGERLGDVGNSGRSSGPHLHFEIWEGGWRTGRAIDPLPDLLRWREAAKSG